MFKGEPMCAKLAKTPLNKMRVDSWDHKTDGRTFCDLLHLSATCCRINWGGVARFLRGMRACLEMVNGNHPSCTLISGGN